MHGLKALMASSLLLLAGCVATGHNFDASKLATLTPGQTTMAQAVGALSGLPDQIYVQSDGTTLAYWRFHMTFVPDGLYTHKEAVLQFGPDGRLMRLVDSTNILLETWERQKLLGVVPPPTQPAVAAASMEQWISIPGPGEPERMPVR